jgi:hypothetical protein
MGLFDSLYVDCPCGQEIEFQSKADPDRYCRRFSLADCPANIAGDLIGDSEKCSKCGRYATIRGAVMITADFTPSDSGEQK